MQNAPAQNIKTLRASRAQTLGVAALLFVLSAALFWPVTKTGFIDLDDYLYVVDNPHLEGGLGAQTAAWAFTTTRTGNWHPVTWLSHALDVQFHGLAPAGHHVTSVLLHAANAALLFLFLSQITSTMWRPCLAAALFAVHPLHIESVAWISERKDVLSTAFGLLCLIAYAAYVRRRKIGDPLGPRGIIAAWISPFFIFSFLLLALGLMSKPMLVTVPLLMLLLDYWPLARMELRPANWRAGIWLLVEKIPFFILIALSCVLTFVAQHSVGAVKSVSGFPLTERVANAIVACAGYLIKFVWPANLAIFYPRPSAFPWWQIAGSALLLIAITLIAIRLVRTRRYIVVGWFWFLISLVPVIGLVQVGEQAMADRYMYIPSIGLCVIVGWLAGELAVRSRPARLWAIRVAALITALLAFETRIQLRCWKSPEALFQHAVQVTEKNAMAHNLLAHALARSGNLAESEANYLAALAIVPQDADMQVECAIVQARLGKTTAALERLTQVVQQHPADANAQYNLATVLALRGDVAGAISHYRESLRLDPNYVDALNNLAWIRAANADPALRNGDEAVRLAQKACELTGNRRPLILGTLAAAYAETGRFSEATATARQAQDVALAQGRPEIARKNAELLELYQAGKPYHETPANPVAPANP